MYAWVWRHLPGPRSVRVVTALGLIVLLAAALFLWGFPWLEETFGINQVTVG